MDQLVRAITAGGMVKAVAVSTRELTERARNIHKTLPVGTAALGRTLAAASMMGNALKAPDASLTLQIKGGGPLGTILAVSDAAGDVRGYVQNPHIDLPLREDGKLDVGAAVGCDGTLTVIKDLRMKEPYVGSVGLLGGEIAEDLAAYFVESEPGAGEDVISKVEGGVLAAGAVTGPLDRGLSPAELLRTVLPDFEVEILETCPITYRCYCSRDRVERALISMGVAELEDMLAQQGGCELGCQFCDETYRFSAQELRELLDSMKNG